MSVRRRLDVELVRRKLAVSRESAQQLIADGLVTVDGQQAGKPARMVLDSAAVVVHRPQEEWASRGAHKLLGALAAFQPLGLAPPEGRRALDAGASTGGFTDVLLRRGAAGVIAVDVGYGQLLWRLRDDPRVVTIDRCNIRYLEPGDLPWAPDLIVADLSFISLRLVLPALTRVVQPSGDLVLMVKPQFEVGREALGKGGVVHDAEQRQAAVATVGDAAATLGWATQATAESPLPGPAGNIEHFLWLRASLR